MPVLTRRVYFNSGHTAFEGTVSASSLQLLLAKLHAQLAKHPTLSAEERRLIEVVVADCEQIDRSGDTRQGLIELALHFSVKHPTVAASLRELMDLLAHAGV